LLHDGYTGGALCNLNVYSLEEEMDDDAEDEIEDEEMDDEDEEEDSV